MTGRSVGTARSGYNNPAECVSKIMMTSSNGTFSALLAICAGNSPVPGESHTQRPVTRSFDVFFDLRLIKQLRKQSWGWWFETLSPPLWRHCNVKSNLSIIFYVIRVYGVVRFSLPIASVIIVRICAPHLIIIDRVLKARAGMKGGRGEEGVGGIG